MVSDKTWRSKPWKYDKNFDGPCCRCGVLDCAVWQPNWEPHKKHDTLVVRGCTQREANNHEDCCGLCERCGKDLGLVW